MFLFHFDQAGESSGYRQSLRISGKYPRNKRVNQPGKHFWTQTAAYKGGDAFFRRSVASPAKSFAEEAQATLQG
jgi:hypothetical protein